MSETNTQESTRYVVGRKEYFVSIDYETKGGYPLYLPWEDKLNKIILIEVEPTEHHKVAWDQDPTEEKKYDGFVFKLNKSNDERFTEGMLFNNQYPSASYGQLSDAGDWRLSLRIQEKGKTTDELLAHPLIDYAYGRHQFENIEVFLGGIHRNLRHSTFQNDDKAPMKQALQEFYDKVRNALQETYGVKVELVKKFEDVDLLFPSIIR